MIKHIYPHDQGHNGVSLYGDYIDDLLKNIAQPPADIWHFEIGYTGSSELWKAYECHKKSRPYIITLHDPPIGVGRPFERFLPSRSWPIKVLRKLLDKTWGQLVIRRVVRGADAVVVLNPLAKASLMQKYGLAPQKLFDSPLPVLTPLTVTASTSKTLRLLFFGNVSSRKGVEVLLQACGTAKGQLGDWRLDIAGGFDGDKNYRNQLTQQIGALDLDQSVQLLGFVEENQLVTLITSADIIILPYFDPGIIHASGPLITGLAAGRAVIATNIPIFSAEITNGQNGLLVKPGDAQELAQTLVKLAGAPDLRKQFGARAQQIIESTHNDSTIIASLEKVYQSI